MTSALASLKTSLVVGSLLTAILLPAAPVRAQTPTDSALAAAQLAYNSLEYERAAVLLDELVASFGPSTVAPERMLVVAAAYELRARTRLQLTDVDGARSDFQKLLLTNPGHQPSAQLTVGSRGRTMFDEVRSRTVGLVELSIVPAEAAVTIDLDSRRIPTAATTLALVGGSHRITASGTGYANVDQEFYVEAGGTLKLALTLVRVSSTITLVTSPPNVEVIVNGVSRGRTELDPNATADGAATSKPFQVTALQNGRYRFEFRRDCFVGADREYDIAQPNDYTPDFSPVRLTPAVAALTVTTAAPDAQVYIDNALRGPAPFSASDICQGTYAIEARNRFGRDLRRVSLKPGQTETFAATIRPAFAVVSDSGASKGVRGGTNYQMAAEDDFRGTATMMLFVPDEKQTAGLIAQNRLPEDWLKFNLLRQPLDNATSIGVQLRREIGSSMASALGAQGLAAVARDPAGDGADMFLILLAPGSAVPDVIRWRPGNQQSIRSAIAALDATPSWLRSSIGLLAIDVLELDGAGAVVAAVEPGGSAEAAGVRAGEAIVSAGGARVSSASQLLEVLTRQRAGQPLPLELRNQAGVVRKVDLAVRAVPTIVSLEDQSLLSNKLAIDYRYRGSIATAPLDEAAIALNLAAVLMRLGSWADAETELQRVDKAVAAGKLPPSLTDAVTGTAQYLLGLCAEARRDFVEAERAWKRASETRGNLLTENGAPVKELADRKLAQLRGSRTDGRQ